MTNKERYQRAFSALHASGDFALEAKEMKKTKIVRFPRLIAACAALVLMLGLSTAVYAADIGGIQRTVQLWLHGDQTNATLVVEDGSYTLSYTDEDGNAVQQQGGGMAFDIFGRERPLTEEELLVQLNTPEVEYRDDGTVWVYYYNQCVEITDKFDDNGVCYVQLVANGKPLYLTVKYGNGCAYGPHAYVNPNSFN